MLIQVMAIREKKGNDDTFIRKNLEVDFVANKNGKKYYIQSALDITNEEKFKQETKSLLNINDAIRIVDKNQMTKDAIIINNMYLSDYTYKQGELVKSAKANQIIKFFSTTQ